MRTHAASAGSVYFLAEMRRSGCRKQASTQEIDPLNTDLTGAMSVYAEYVVPTTP